jgi:hypothetical protein
MEEEAYAYPEEKEIYFISSGGPLSPMLVIILIAVLPVAIILDAIGMVIVLTGADDMGILDLIGTITILPLLSFIGGSNLDEKMEYLKQKQTGLQKFKAEKLKELEKLEKEVKTLQRLKWLRPLITFLGEVFFWVGGLLPCWTICTLWTIWDIIKS